MLQLIFQDYWPYAVGVLVAVFVVYNIWSGVREFNDDRRLVFDSLSELFEKRPESYVARSLSAPKSSNVGKVTIGSSSAITAVYSGPNEIFIGSPDKDEFFSIPWHRIDSISDSNGKQLTLLVNRSTGRPTHIEIPWSDNMTLDGWERHNYMSE